MRGFDIGWDTRGSGAGSTGNTWLGWVSINWGVAVEPEHVCGVIIPEGERQNHAVLESLGHGGKSTVKVVDVLITEHSLLGLAEAISKRVTRVASDG